jgi:hypothetical protein
MGAERRSLRWGRTVNAGEELEGGRTGRPLSPRGTEGKVRGSTMGRSVKWEARAEYANGSTLDDTAWDADMGKSGTEERGAIGE